MSNIIPALFNKSLIAAAVVSLSACSTTPRMEDYDLSRVGEGILKAGRTTADVSERAWNKTAYLLGFTDGDSAPQSDEGLLMDAEDVALLEESTTVPRDTMIRPIVIRSAIPTRPEQDDEQVKTPINAELAEISQTPDFQTPMKRKSDELTQTSDNSDTTTTQIEPAPLAEDRVHKVAANETLWEIAKKTTGDANNWHVLADVNNLGPNASVFRGDLLIIPADMLKPALNEDKLSDASASQTSKPIYVDTQNLKGTLKSQPSALAAQPQLEIPATVQADASDSMDNQPVSGKAFKLHPGETLWTLAKRTTGDATNWKAIAGQNNLSAEQASVLQAGQTIYVPEELIKPELESAIHETTPDLDTAANKIPAEPETTQEAIQSAADTTRTSKQEGGQKEANAALRTLTISSASALSSAATETDFLNVGASTLSASSSTISAGQPIKIVEATFKSDGIAAPLGQRPDTIKSADAGTHSPEQIMVSGTYYPKAIYNNADFSSSLLMRVSPGTTLEVSKSMGNWYQVNTSKGLGYVHQRDIK